MIIWVVVNVSMWKYFVEVWYGYVLIFVRECFSFWKCCNVYRSVFFGE